MAPVPPASAVVEDDKTAEPTKLDMEKQDRVRALRLKLCRRPDAFPETATIIDDAGNLNKDYFSRVHMTHKRWTRQDAVKLVQGLREYSLHYKDIREHLLPDWTEKELKVRTMRLLGVRDLGMFRGFSFKDVAPDFFKEQYEKNFEEGTAAGKWELGMYDNRLAPPS